MIINNYIRGVIIGSNGEDGVKVLGTSVNKMVPIKYNKY
jgi:hypothetical protein